MEVNVGKIIFVIIKCCLRDKENEGVEEVGMVCEFKLSDETGKATQCRGPKRFKEGKFRKNYPLDLESRVEERTIWK